MTPEAVAFLQKAQGFLQKAHGMLNQWPDEAGRSAYLAAFHAAQAFIFQQTGNVSKTHGGVQAQFARLTRSSPALDVELRGFLARAYNMKAVSDYGTDPRLAITQDQAATAIATATRFVAVVTDLLPQS